MNCPAIARRDQIAILALRRSTRSLRGFGKCGKARSFGSAGLGAAYAQGLDPSALGVSRIERFGEHGMATAAWLPLRGYIVCAWCGRGKRFAGAVGDWPRPNTNPICPFDEQALRRKPID